MPAEFAVHVYETLAEAGTAPAAGTAPSWYTAGAYEIEIAAERMPARASLRPMYDPASERPRG